MLSPLCHACHGMLLRLGTNRRQDREDLSMSPKTCHICANIEHRLRIWKYELLDLEEVAFRVIEQSLEHVKISIDWTAKSQHEDSFYIHVETGIGRTTSGPVTEADTCGSAAISFLGSKLRQCLHSDTHGDCQRSDREIAPYYPTRLLNVKNRLIVTVEDTGPHTEGLYASLSHCWGKSRLVQLTCETEQNLRNGLDIDCLSKTFREAIRVCQALDVSYIWIDSLCIFQDSATDWQEQAALMSRVYTNALFNIAATSARDGSVGLKHAQYPRVQEPFLLSAPICFWRPKDERISTIPDDGHVSTTYVVSFPSSFDMNTTDPVEAPLNRRAWVMQESLLSRRIMHFTASGVYWHCLSNLANQSYPDGLPHYFELLPKSEDKLFLAKRSTTGNSHIATASKNKIYDIWNRVCSEYSDRKLTVQSDKLVAINGIADRIASLNSDRIICGLWEQRLLPQLLWYLNANHNPPRPFPDAWIAPSWSWASHNRNMKHAAHLWCDHGAPKAEIERIHVSSHASGQLRNDHASLTLRGKLLSGFLDVHADRPFFPYQHTKTFLVCGTYSKQIELAMLDLYIDGAKDFQGEIVCLRIYEDTCDEKADKYDYWDWRTGSLILQKVQSGPADEYRRIGILLLKEDELVFYADHESAEEHSVTII